MTNTSGQNMLAPIDMRDLTSLGKIFVESRFFADSKDAAQAVVKILAGRELGFGPVTSMTGVYIVSGKPALSSNLIAARIKSSGRYDYRVTKMDDKECIIEFFEIVNGVREKIGVSPFTMEDAKKAGTKNTDRYPRNMLFARAMTNGARWFCPDVFSGAIYTPDELGANVETDSEGNIVRVINPQSETPQSEPQPQAESIDDEFILKLDARAVELIDSVARWDDEGRRKRLVLVNGYLNQWYGDDKRKWLIDALWRVDTSTKLSNAQIAATLNAMALEKKEDGKYYETDKSKETKKEFDRIIAEYQIKHGQIEMSL